MRGFGFWLGTGMVALGSILLLVVAGLYAYGEVQRLQFESELVRSRPVLLADPVPTITPIAEPTSTRPPTATVDPAATRSPARTPTDATPTPTETPPPEPTETPVVLSDPLPARRIIAPKIGLDSEVVESKIKNGEWVVPKFVAGHLEGTAKPGTPGNAVFSGHVSSIASGNVFENLGRLSVGDEVLIHTQADEFRYRVTHKLTVKNDDMSVIQNAGDERITLITCTGTWLPLRRDFSHRLVIVAIREQ
jgi:LPXTG-site transpeptidase (sortase) family protein